MNRGLLTAALIAALWAGAAAAEVTFAGGDGKSKSRAVMILGARSDDEGVAAEYAWVRQNYSTLRIVNQALLQDGAQVYDVLHLKGNGVSFEVYFDISDFFGKS